MTEYIDIKTTAKLLNVTERHIRRLCKAGVLTGAVKDGSNWRIPKDADARLAAAYATDKLAGSGELANVPAKKRADAFRRLGVVQECKRYCSTAVRNGTCRTIALKAFAAKKKMALRTLRRWLADYKDEGLIGLVDHRGRGQFKSQAINPEAFEAFKAMYLSEQRLSLRTCWLNLKYINNSEARNWSIPSLQYMYRYVAETIPEPVRVLHREGLAAYEAKCAPYVQVDPDSVQPGQIWVGDHSQFNCWVRHRGKWVRPWITAWQDMRSRLIVGLHISACPNQTTVLSAMKRAVDEYGPPDSVKIDNGRDYDSEMFTGTTKVRRRAANKGYLDEQMVAGIYAMMGIGVSFAIPYHPQAKSIERFFDTLDCQFTKTLPTYCGKDHSRKPEKLAELLKSEKVIAQAYSIESFSKMVGQYVEIYNNSSHTGFGMDGKTPTQVFSQRQSKRVLPDGLSDLLLRVWSGELAVGKNGVRFKGIWYGQFDATLQMYQGRKVRVAYDPDDLRSVDVYDATTMALITTASQNQLINYGKAVDEDALRNAMRQKSAALKATKRFKDTRLAANMDLPTLTLNAMREASKPQKTEPARAPRLRPVITPLNQQLERHKKLEVIKEVKKAAGAETITKVLDIDLSSLAGKKGPDIKLFND